MKKGTRSFLPLGLGVLTLALIFGGILIANAQTSAITSQLSLGSRGTEVTKLQTFLATDSTVYPSGLVTGYFGSLTEQAVRNFQTKYGIAAVGRVGPITLAKINELIAGGGMVVGGGGGDLNAPIITNLMASVSATSTSGTTTPSNTASVTITWNTNENARDKVFYSTSPLTMTEATPPATEPFVSGNVATDGTFRAVHSLMLPSLSTNTLYYYLVMSTDANGNVMMVLPQTFRTNP